MLGVRLDEELDQRLSALSKRTSRSKSFLTKAALEQYISEEEFKEKEKQIAISRWENYQETGEVVSNDDMFAWLDSWGSEHEKPCPQK